MKPIRVLIVEDSPFMQGVLAEILREAPGFHLAGIAKTGKEAIALASSCSPDIVTLDLVLPDIDGLQVLTHLIAYSLPVLVLSSLVHPENSVTLQALEMGAVDYLAKPLNPRGDLPQFREDILTRLQEIAKVGPEKLKNVLAKAAVSVPREAFSTTLVVIGSSAGGPLHLRDVIPRLPPDLPAGILLLQHLPPTFSRQWATHMAAESKIRVKEAQAGDVFLNGTALVAPGDQILKVEWVQGGWGAVSFSQLTSSPHRVLPWIDASMATAALLYGKKCVGVLLSGMGSDGVEGMRKIKELGGITIAQDEISSLIFGMPKAAIAAGVVDQVLPIGKIAEAIVKSVELAASRKT